MLKKDPDGPFRVSLYDACVMEADQMWSQSITGGQAGRQLMNRTRMVTLWVIVLSIVYSKYIL